MSIMKTVLNDEQLLDFALHYLSDKNSDDYHHPVAHEIVVSYIMDEFNLKDIEFDDYMIRECAGELLLDHALHGLVAKGYLEPQFNEDGTITHTMGTNDGTC